MHCTTVNTCRILIPIIPTGRSKFENFKCVTNWRCCSRNHNCRINLSLSEDIVLQDFTHRDSITSLVAKMRICCFGSPTIFMVTNVRKCQTERVNIFWIYFAFILNSGSFFFLFTKFFQNKTKEKATRTQNKFQIYQIIQFGIFLHLWL